MNVDAVALSLFSHRMAAFCEEMGAVLKRSAISTNIRDREDFSCALFDAHGELIAQAAHIPVHLGSMAFAMSDVINRFDWHEGDIIVFNDPFLGGTHLPDITVLMPVYLDETRVGFSAARAHHADIGGIAPGSMGVETRLQDEGLIISPCYWFKAGQENMHLAEQFRHAVRAPEERLGDLSAQRAACSLAALRLSDYSVHELRRMFAELTVTSESYGRKTIAGIPDGLYTFEDTLEDDGLGSGALPIKVRISIHGEQAVVDFSGTADQCRGPVNCPLAVTTASVYYVFRCLMPKHTPQTAAIFHDISITAPIGCMVNAKAGAPVAAGNVETSQRIVDVVLGALAQALPGQIPAAAQGTMNNVIFGADTVEENWVYYETLAGGMGAFAQGNGLSAVQCHMTNTKNSSIEVLEMHYPIQVREYAIRSGSGGKGAHAGGDGLVREWEVTQGCHLSLLTERRSSRPYGLAGGGEGQCGRNRLWHDGQWIDLPGKGSMKLKKGDRIRIETPGGGGFGQAKKQG